MLLRTPSLTAAAVATVALGIAVNTAMFSVVNAVLVKPLPYPEPERIVMFQNTFQGLRIGSAAPVEFNWWRQQTALFEDVSAYAFGVANLTGTSLSEQIPTLRVSARFFQLTGAAPLHGRTFAATDDTPGVPQTVVLTAAFWQRHFGGDPGAIGHRLTINGASHEVIGVMRQDFADGHLAEQVLLSGDIRIDAPPDVYLPLQLDPNSVDSGHFFNVAGRLRPGVSLAVADERLRGSYDEFRRTRPNISPEAGFGLQRLQDAIVGRARRPLVILFAAVGLVLLIACANVANLLLARATARRGEIAIRVALGASRRQIVRQLMTESLVLSLAGGGLGLAAGYLGILGLLRLSPAIPRLGLAGANVVLDWRVLAFTLAVTVGTAFVFGLIPALRTSRAASGALAVGEGRGGIAARHTRTRSSLVVAEIALAAVLMTGAALLIRTFVEIRRVEPGFTARNVLTMRMLPTGARFENAATAVTTIGDGLRRIRALSGVATAAITCCLPLEDRFYIRFHHPGGPASGRVAGAVTASDGYFETFRIPILRGRPFTERDDTGPPVAIINETLARQLAPDDPLETHLVIGNERWPIVGIVADVRDNALDRDPRPIVYRRVEVDSGSSDGDPLVWVVRTRDAGMVTSTDIQEQLRQATGGLPVARPRTLEEVLSVSTTAGDFNALVLTIFGASALLLAAIGIYGVTTYSVTQRTQEFGIRMALGAEPAHVRNSVLRHNLRLALTGIGCGLLLASGLTRFLSSLLFGVTPQDPQVFVIVSLVLAGVAIVAAWRPAIRAGRVDPVVSLRYW